MSARVWMLTRPHQGRIVDTGATGAAEAPQRVMGGIGRRRCSFLKEPADEGEELSAGAAAGGVDGNGSVELTRHEQQLARGFNACPKCCRLGTTMFWSRRILDSRASPAWRIPPASLDQSRQPKRHPMARAAGPRPMRRASGARYLALSVIPD
ncbi:hypothetical protein CCMA1212_004440 [Trichoderma ghanense]|uniref:Uncharacterized protein n=1 Tax=Trichoderma ghanense TaxID=65468 RepID=A0ABY2H7E0_9HYPO